MSDENVMGDEGTHIFEEPEVVPNKFSPNEIVNNLKSHEQDNNPKVNGLSINTKKKPKKPTNGARKTPTSPSFKRPSNDTSPKPDTINSGDSTWLKRISKFNPSEPDWRTNIFNFNKAQTAPVKKKNSKFQSKKERVSLSDKLARIRAAMLLDSLALGYTASNLVSSVFLLDEHETKRAPLIPHLVGMRIHEITDNLPEETAEEQELKARQSAIFSPRAKAQFKRKMYRFDMEYGVGDNRARWSIVKSYKEISGFASKLKLLSTRISSGGLNLRKLDLPNFPRHKDHRFTDTDASDDELEQDDEDDHGTILSTSSAASNLSNATGGSRFHQLMGRISNISRRRKQYRNTGNYSEQLEKYFMKLFFELALRPQANRLFTFFELSPIGILLSNDNGYKGKQGNLLIATSAKKQGWKVGHLRAQDLGAMIKRHTLKWFIVRESYILYVADINSTTILEVFLVDEFFKLKYNGGENTYKTENEESSEDDDGVLEVGSKKHTYTPHLDFQVENKERKMKMVARSAHEMNNWIRSIQIMQSKTEWAQPHRFGSFAPIRENCFAQWFVDARDYWWAASSAIEMAKEVIFIHDWWLSPELYLRRPANGNQQWRIDRLLKRKAEQGVKIFVIIYRNIGDFVVIDSSWTKHSLMDLHDNIRVIRSPNQFLQNTFFWAHHEKLLVIDHTFAFLGGIDLCYGRYDTPDHVLVDDAPQAFSDGPTKKGTKFQIFPGKDYSNPRVKDFSELNKPYESMYDRQSVPRMPWHDVHMFTAGQVARDLSRHFVQRWNYLLRQKRPSRPTPLLTPPTNLTAKEIEDLGFKGSCEIQLLRSSGTWSLGLKEDEHSIQNAYLKLIETSEHFVYIENQFFVTASAWDNVVIKNRIGDALVDRIIRAHQEKTPWRAVIVIPLMPGFEAQVDEPEGSSVRVIIQCQYMSISRGSTSIFAKLRKVGIDPESYIQFFSLRKWGKIGEYGKLVSEQLYIHAKTMVVDDRIAIIGSANINERSMKGSRDSEICAVVRDTETVNITMAGKPYLAGKFAHSLRLRLMREHLGIEVDELELVERRFETLEKEVKDNYLEKDFETDKIKTGNFKRDEDIIRSVKVELAAREVLKLPGGTNKWKKYQDAKSQDTTQADGNFNAYVYNSFNHRAGVENVGIRDKKQFSSDPRIKGNEAHKADVEGKGEDHLESKSHDKMKLNARLTLRKWAVEMTSLKSTFIPSRELKEFLENDDEVLKGDTNRELTREEEEILAQRDEQRWEMLKRVYYLQRINEKIEKELKEENLKRAKLGLPLKVREKRGGKSADGLANGNVQASILPDGKVTDGHAAMMGAANADTTPPGPNTGSDILHENRRTTSNLSSGHRDHIPITNLTDEEIDELFFSVLKIRKSKFIDPYVLHDPLDEEFYEDIWFETAYRNTKIFGLIFHCQPDDQVSTWNDYKEYTKLLKAFGMAQDNEILQFRRKKSEEAGVKEEHEKSEDELEEDEIIEDGDEYVDARPTLDSLRTSRSIRLDDLTDEFGMLGVVPGEGPATLAKNPKRSKLTKKFKRRQTRSNEPLVTEVDEEEGDDEREDESEESPENGPGVSIQQVTDAALNDNLINDSNLSKGLKPRKTRKRNGTFTRHHLHVVSDDTIFDIETAEKILSEITGHLVLFPTNWLYKELEGNNWFTNSDRLPPIEIYD